MSREKKNEIIITKSSEGYSAHYKKGNSCEKPEIIINSMRFYDIVDGLIKMPKNVYKKGIKKIYFNEYDFNEISKEEKKIFKGLINILGKFAIGKKNLEYKIEEIKKILIKKEDRRKFLITEISKNEQKSFNSLYKIVKV